MPLALLVAFINNIFWFYSFKIIEGKKEIFIFSALQSVILTIIYFVLPILLFDLKLTKFELVGISMICIGMLLLKL